MNTKTQYIDSRGIKWSMFSCKFDTQEGEFSFHLWAVDQAHAIERLEELKATARVDYKVEQIIPVDGGE